ncbi:MAG TPA: glycosyltransferase family 2 protein [Candidatus Paceibacterota bacterium]|nr:glycosyltransferase family 2 protein [Verrucomicrobiota bacterium]HSA12725.1 glycosyltransferase family 2 protein [Candidatus Paceibacterota bacterium]
MADEMMTPQNNPAEPTQPPDLEARPEASAAPETVLQPLAMGLLDQKVKPASDKACGSLVSVIIPTYNRAWALEKSVRSVFDQTYRPIECIIVDDGSTDNTPNLVAQLVSKCPEGVILRYFKQENGGANSARNRGLMECRGDFICYLDSDDMLLRDSVEARAQALRADPEVDFCYGLCSVRDQQGTELRRMNDPWPRPGEPRISRYLFDTNAPLIRRSTCARVGLWRNDDLHGQEYEYFARLKYFSNKVAFTDRVLSIYVRHEQRSIFDNKSIVFSLAVFRVLIAVKALVLYGTHDNAAERQHLSVAFKSLAKQLYRLKDYSNACAALQEAMVLKWKVRVCAEWLVLKALSILHKLHPVSGA